MCAPQTCVHSRATILPAVSCVMSVRVRERRGSKSSFIFFGGGGVQFYVCKDMAISECITQKTTNVSLLHCTPSFSLADNNH